MYVSPHTRCEMLVGKGDRLVDLVLEKQQEGLEVLIMGEFNAHFDDRRVALDSRASLVENLARAASLVVMNWEPGVVGKWTWGCENRQSVLDYVLVSEWWVDRISRFSIDDDGFYAGSDHNLLLWHVMVGERRENAGEGKGRRRYRKEWRWRTSGKVDWEKDRQKVGEKWVCFRRT